MPARAASALFLAAIAILPATGLPAPDQAQEAADAAALLAAMKQAGHKAPLHALVRVADTPDGGKSSERFLECWIDPAGGRVRTEIRALGRAQPFIVFVASPTGSCVERREVEEVAADARALDLESALVAASAGELLRAALAGDLSSAMKVITPGRATLALRHENVAGMPCTKLHFTGNREADLWVAEGDHLPRRVRGAVPGHALDEVALVMEVGTELKGIDFALALPEGKKPLDLMAARQRWAKLPDEEARWPEVGDGAPDFAALDLAGETHQLIETSEENALVAFWVPEDDETAAQAAVAEKIFLGAKEPKRRFIHVAAGSDREAVNAAIAKHGLKEPVWVAGSHDKNAFRQFRIFKGPVFVKLDDLTIGAITRDPAEAGKWSE